MVITHRHCDFARRRARDFKKGGLVLRVQKLVYRMSERKVWVDSVGFFTAAASFYYLLSERTR